jgi:ATP-dependent DNA helicase RecQ
MLIQSRQRAGGGKSLVFQLPAVVTQKTVIVVSPLLALAKDQIDKWNDVGSSVPAAAYNSTCSDGDKQKICR